MLTEKQLHQKFVQLGRQLHRVTYELLEILPEIYAKNIHIQQGYATIYEYAGRLTGLSRSVVQKVLRAEKHLEAKPALKKLVGKVGIHKVDLVARIATPENERQWAEKVEHMSKPALQELAKEVRAKSLPGENFSTSEMKFGKCQAAEQKITIELDEEMQFLFLKLKNKHGKNMNNKAMLKILLKKIAKQEFPKKNPRKRNVEKTAIKDRKMKVTRYIPSAQKRQAISKTDGHCSYPNCNKPSQHIHHPERFSQTKTHNNLKPVCRVHHEFAHNGLIENETQETNKWQLSFGDLLPADKLYLRYRKQLV